MERRRHKLLPEFILSRRAAKDLDYFVPPLADSE